MATNGDYIVHASRNSVVGSSFTDRGDPSESCS